MRPSAWIAVAVVAVAVSATSAARAEELPKNVVLLDLGLHVAGVGYQRTVLPWLALQFAVDPYVPWTQNLHVFVPDRDPPEPETDVLGVVVRQRLFFHPLGEAPRGFWVSPFWQFGLVMASRGDEEQRHLGSAAAAGASMGYNFLLAKVVVLGLGAGLQFHGARISGGEGTPSFDGFYPTIDINLGYAF